MNVTKKIEKIENSSVRLTATVSKDDLSTEYKSSLAKIAKTIQIPGFRKGHVPASVLERKYGEALKAEVAGALIDKTLNEILSGDDAKDFRPLPYAHPQLEGNTMPELDFSKDFTFTVTYDVFPDVKITNFSGITVKVPQVEIGDEEVQKELKAIQERNASVIDKKADDSLAKGDIVTINYSELDDSGNVIKDSEREGFVFTVGSGENIYKIDDEIIGMKKDETKQITKTYDKKDPDEDLAGKTKKISVTVTALKTRILPDLDDELAQDVSEKYKTLDDLKKDIVRNMNLAMERKIKELKSQSLLEQLMEKNPFDLPKSMIELENSSSWEMIAKQFNTTTEQLKKMVHASGQSEESMLEQWLGNAEKKLKRRIILDKLISDKNISVTPEEIDAEYEKIAQENGITLDEVKEHYEDLKAKEYLVDEIKDSKLFEELYKEVKVAKGDKTTFEALFEEGK